MIKPLKKLLALGLLALPAALSAQWALYGKSGAPHALLDAPGGGWIIATERNIFKLSPSGQVVWGQRFENEQIYACCLKAWLAPDDGIVAVLDANSEGKATLIKLSAAGSVVWKKTYTLDAAVQFNEFCAAPDGGTIMAGWIDSDLLVCRCSAEGEIVWQGSYGTGDTVAATAVAPTSDGGVIVLGVCTPADSGASDLWVLKLSSAGEIDWQKRIGGAADDGAETVYQTVDGGYLIAGYSASFDTDGLRQFWLLKLSAAGAVQRELTLNYTNWGSGLKAAPDGSFVAAFASLPSDPSRAVIVTIAGDGTILREKQVGPYSSNNFSFSGVEVLPTADGGCLLSLTGTAAIDDPHPDSLLMKVPASGEVEWMRIYGSRYSPDWLYLLGWAGDGGYVLAGTTNSWGSISDALFTWLMRTAPDGSIGPNCAFVRAAVASPLEEVSTQKEVAATVTDTQAGRQSPGLVAATANIALTPWGPTELPALGQPTCALTIHASTGGGIAPAAGSHVYATGTEIPISAAPSEKYVFGEWVGSVRLDRTSATIVMDGDKEIHANFNYVGEGIEKVKNEMCFVATAAYGDPSHPDVEVLRRFRDRYLKKSRWGRSLVDIYYRYSPPVARFVEKSPVLRAVSRAVLSPVVAVCSFLLNSGTQLQE